METFLSPFGKDLLCKWLDSPHAHEAARENDDDDDHHHHHHQQPSAHSPASPLLTFSTVRSLHHANGFLLYHDHVLPAIRAAEHEVILATCFWAASTSRSALCAALLHLSQKALRRGRAGEKIRVRLCFSSRSLLQKLFHTSSAQGHVYPPASWAGKLGLPAPEQLRGLDLQVKSLFFRPFSVLHSKFVVVDRRVAFMPSCNVSWEAWCECVVVMEGCFVARLLEFWQGVWEARHDADGAVESSTLLPGSTNNHEVASRYPQDDGDTPDAEDAPPTGDETAAILLPSRHHSSLFTSLFFLPRAAPPTPLNTFLLTAFAHAKLSILLLTPNLTSAPVRTALVAALARGVNVQLITNRRMMVVEQLVTAGTLTEICVWRLVRAYRTMRRRRKLQSHARPRADGGWGLEEGSSLAAATVGNLKVRYFRALRSAEARKLHVKCSVVDGEVYVLGSGNMDRASWYTSQELGVALLGDFAPFVRDLKADLVLEDYFG